MDITKVSVFYTLRQWRIFLFSVQKLPNVGQTRGQDGLLLPRLEFPGLSGPRESAKPLSEGDQQSLTLADADQPCLLTVEALRMHVVYRHQQ